MNKNNIHTSWFQHHGSDVNTFSRTVPNNSSRTAVCGVGGGSLFALTVRTHLLF